MRKLQKHAPARRCQSTPSRLPIPDVLTILGLVLTAQLESQTVALASRQDQGLVTPSKSAELLERDLRRELESEKTHKEDIYQAEAALAWFSWSHERWEQASGELPTSMLPGADLDEKKTAPPLRDWGYVCAIRSAYIRCAYAR